MDSDTIVNTEYEKKLKLTVIEKVGRDYIVEIALQPLSDLSMTTTVDSEVVLFRRTLFLSDFQTDIIQNGGW
jgi:hypothetical protein